MTLPETSTIGTISLLIHRGAVFFILIISNLTITMACSLFCRTVLAFRDVMIHIVSLIATIFDILSEVLVFIYLKTVCLYDMTAVLELE